MKTNVRSSSLAAYKKIKKMNQKELAVFGVILTHGPVSNQEIADRLGWQVNRVTGRTFDLREKGLVEEAYRDFYKSEVKVIHWQKVPLSKIAIRNVKGALCLEAK